MERGVKLVGSRFDEILLDGQFTVNSTT